MEDLLRCPDFRSFFYQNLQDSQCVRDAYTPVPGGVVVLWLFLTSPPSCPSVITTRFSILDLLVLELEFDCVVTVQNNFTTSNFPLNFFIYIFVDFFSHQSELLHCHLPVEIQSRTRERTSTSVTFNTSKRHFYKINFFTYSDFW